MMDQREGRTEKRQNKNSFADLRVGDRCPGLCILSLFLKCWYSPVKRRWAVGELCRRACCKHGKKPTALLKTWICRHSVVW